MENRIEKPIAECTAAELREYAEVVCGLEISAKSKSTTIVAKLREAGITGGMALVPAPVEQTPPPADTETAATSQAADTQEKLPPGWRVVEALGRDPDSGKSSMMRRKQVCVIIQTSDQPGGDQPVPLGVNGSTMYVPRGQPCWIWEEYYEALNNAVEYIYDETDRGLQEPRQKHSYPFSVSAGGPDALEPPASRRATAA